MNIQFWRRFFFFFFKTTSFRDKFSGLQPKSIITEFRLLNFCFKLEEIWKRLVKGRRGVERKEITVLRIQSLSPYSIISYALCAFNSQNNRWGNSYFLHFADGEIRRGLIWSTDLPGGASDKEPACQCRRHKSCGFDPRVGKIPWRRAWQPAPEFLPQNPMDRGAWRVTVHKVAQS